MGQQSADLFRYSKEAGNLAPTSATCSMLATSFPFTLPFLYRPAGAHAVYEKGFISAQFASLVMHCL